MDNGDLLGSCVIDLISEYGRYGYKRIIALLSGRLEGQPQVAQIWKEELKVPN